MTVSIGTAAAMRTSADDGPNTLTPDEAIARLHVWAEDPGEALTRRLCEAGVACAKDLRASNVDKLRAASEAWTAAKIERVHTVRGSIGAAWSADEVRALLRRARMIVEVRGQTMAGAMLLARGCHIACQDFDGRWIGVGSRGANDNG